MSQVFEVLQKNPMIMVVGIVFLFCLFLIPCVIYGRHVKEKGKKFIESHYGQAMLLISGEKIEIDGKEASMFDHDILTKEEANVVLDPGEHVISALFKAARSVDRFNVKKRIEVKVVLEANCQYTLGGYEYSAEQRRNYYKGAVPEHVLDMQVGNKYLICYKESDLFGNKL